MHGRRTKPPVSEVELHGYADGELGRERQRAVRAHLSISPGNLAKVEGWRRQNEAIRAAFPPVDPASLPSPLLLRPDNVEERGSQRLRERWLAYPVVFAFVCGAIFSGSVAFLVSRLQPHHVSPPSRAAPTPADPNGPIVEQAIASLGEFEAEAASRPSQYDIRQGSSPATPVMPALSEGGLKLAGIRSVPDGSGQMLCAYYAKPDGGHIALCAGKAAAPDETPAKFVGGLPAAAVTWRQRGADYVLLGALSEANLKHLGEAVRSQIEGFGDQ